MFGYIKPYTPELKMREFEAYRGMYCGLCRAMGKVTGQASRLTLNYEFVFLAAVRMMLRGESPEFKGGRCALHPLKKRSFCTCSPELEYAAGVSALLARSKVKDDLSDERGVKKLAAVLLTPYFSHASRRAGRKLGDAADRAAEEMSEALSLLSSLEEACSQSLDECAEAFGRITAHIFSAGLEGGAYRIAREIGRSVGRFIYLADAVDDLTSDVKKGRFNPIYSLYGESSAEQRDGRVYLSSSVAEAVTTGALCDLDRLGAALELACDGGDPTLEAILKNTVYLGMPKLLEQTVSRRTGRLETDESK